MSLLRNFRVPKTVCGEVVEQGWNPPGAVGTLHGGYAVWHINNTDLLWGFVLLPPSCQIPYSWGFL